MNPLSATQQEQRVKNKNRRRRSRRRSRNGWLTCAGNQHQSHRCETELPLGQKQHHGDFFVVRKHFAQSTVGQLRVSRLLTRFCPSLACPTIDEPIFGDSFFFPPTIVRVVCITSKRLMCHYTFGRLHYKIFACLLAAGFNGLAGITFKEVCSHYSFRCVVGVRYPFSASGCFRLLLCLWVAFPSLRGSFRCLYASRAAVPLIWVVRVLCRQQFEIFPDDKTQTQSYSSCTPLGFKSCDGRQKAFQVNCFAWMIQWPA